MVVSFTGYRPEKMPFCEEDSLYRFFRSVLRKVIMTLIENEFTSFISGGARGFDLWAAEDVLNLREKYPTAKLQMAIPFLKQAEAWISEDREKYQNILSAADQVVVLSEKYKRGCYFARNRYMVEQADLILCGYDGFEGGTAYTVNYALKCDKTIVQIDPKNGSISVIGNKFPNIDRGLFL